MVPDILMFMLRTFLKLMSSEFEMRRNDGSVSNSASSYKRYLSETVPKSVSAITLESVSYTHLAIIDGDRAVFGDVSFDLDSPWMINDAFLEGYGEISSAFSPEEDRRKKQVYNLLFALTDAYVWRVEYCSENNYQSCLTQAKSILQDK